MCRKVFLDRRPLVSIEEGYRLLARQNQSRELANSVRVYPVGVPFPNGKTPCLTALLSAEHDIEYMYSAPCGPTFAAIEITPNGDEPIHGSISLLFDARAWRQDDDFLVRLADDGKLLREVTFSEPDTGYCLTPQEHSAMDHYAQYERHNGGAPTPWMKLLGARLELPTKSICGSFANTSDAGSSGDVVEETMRRALRKLGVEPYRRRKAIPSD